MELALRFFAFYEMPNAELKEIKDIGEFLNNKNREIALSKDFDQDHHGNVFRDTFDMLDASLGVCAFKKFDPVADKFAGPFLISAFEAVALGVAANIAEWRKISSPEKKLTTLVKRLWSKRDFTTHIGIGVPARDRLRWSIPFGRSHFVP